MARFLPGAKTRQRPLPISCGAPTTCQTLSLTPPPPSSENMQSQSIQSLTTSFGPLRGNRTLIPTHFPRWRRQDCGSGCQKRAGSTPQTSNLFSRMSPHSRDRMSWEMISKDLFPFREFQSRPGVSRGRTTTFFGIPSRNPVAAMTPI